ncbi:MAG: class I poly(R)-hydroxyalkanoic acid synthase [Alphaproteobacteria bacterium]|nr:class I poly(R)-hydroxyalkanoic acid synthase [Alphaproteobacteria bacterium]
MKPLDPVALTQAMAHAYEKAQPALQAFAQKMTENLARQSFDPLNVNQAAMEYWEKIAENPEKFIALHQDYWKNWIALWNESTRRWLGEQAQPIIIPEKSDRRFKAPEWNENAIFDFIKQSYLLTCQWLERAVREGAPLDAEKRQKLAFAAKLYADALSPSNFLLTNPEVLKETLRTGGDNLVKGFQNLMEDLERGGGELKISTTDYSAFELGKNIATTPGKIIYQNELVQLIQYAPQTETVHETPLLIIPPWINKYYILDLRPDNSLIKYCVEQGHSVFVISWVNPDASLSNKGFEDYLQEGVLEILAHVEKVTNQKQTNVIGYCLGGTLLSIALSYLTAKGQAGRVKSATFLTTLIDFEDSGDLKLFMDDTQLAAMDEDMAEKGVLEARALQKTFSLLRANDLIWSFVVNNYLMGKEPFPFDLLYWNDDSTNMPAAMQRFYLRKMYRENLLAKANGLNMLGVPIDVRSIKTPAYFLSTREDHIAPWKATYAGAHLLGGKVTFTLAASGHIAGVINPPDSGKYCHWVREAKADTPDDWLKTAKEHPGSWWPDWAKWIKPFGGKMIAARKIGKSLEDAPGSYVKRKADC